MPLTWSYSFNTDTSFILCFKSGKAYCIYKSSECILQDLRKYILPENIYTKFYYV